jgi:hypothetical protein
MKWFDRLAAAPALAGQGVEFAQPSLGTQREQICADGCHHHHTRRQDTVFSVN